MTRTDFLGRTEPPRRYVAPLALAVVVALMLVPRGAAAQENTGAGSFSSGVDFVTDYYFRGIVQETGGFIAQPWLDASLTLMDSDTASVSVTAGTWSSLHSAAEGGDPEMWYETDFYASLGLGFAEAWSADVTYTAYMSPNQSFGTVKELSFGIGYDDGLLSPYANFAFELDGQADGGDEGGEGAYLELGVEPGLDLGDSPAAVSFPVALGLSLNDYYQNRPTLGAPEQDSTYGFFSVGAIVAVPLPVPAAYGSWELTGGVTFLFFGDGLKNINGSDDDIRTIGVFGVGVSY